MIKRAPVTSCDYRTVYVAYIEGKLHGSRFAARWKAKKILLDVGGGRGPTCRR
jgi:hypothetical protein